jgi:hypothetical protein
MPETTYRIRDGGLIDFETTDAAVAEAFAATARVTAVTEVSAR